MSASARAPWASRRGRESEKEGEDAPGHARLEVLRQRKSAVHVGLAAEDAVELAEEVVYVGLGRRLVPQGEEVGFGGLRAAEGALVRSSFAPECTRKKVRTG